MNPILRAILLSMGVGIGALMLAFIIMMSASPLPTSILTAIIYLFAGFWIGWMKIKGVWIAPLLMNIPIWVVFIPMGMDIWPPVIHIWYFLVPPVVSVFSAYVGIYLSTRVLRSKGTDDSSSKSFGTK